MPLTHPGPADPAAAGTPLSGPEAEIWHVQRRTPASPCCWIGEYLEILGPLDPAAFGASLRDVVAAIPGLHAAFQDGGDGPRRFPHPPRHWALDTEDLSAQPDPAATAEARIHALITHAPGLDGQPLFRFGLFRLGPERWIWFQSFHHIVMDGAGVRLVAALVADRYSARVAHPSAEPGLAAAASQDAMAAAEDHWRTVLQDWTTPIRLAGRTAPPAPLSISVPVRMHAVVGTRLRRAGRAGGLPLPHIVMAAAALWLNATSGSTSVVFGLAVRDRRGQAARTPAMMTNVVPVRVEVSASSDLLAIARDIARQRRAGRPHEQVRTSRILRLASMQDAASFGLAVNVMALDYSMCFGGHPCRARNVSIGPVDDLCLCLYDRNDGQGVTLRLNGNPALYTPDALGGLATRLARILVQLARAPGRPASSLDLLGGAERRLLLETWNDTSRDVPDAGIAGLFMAQVGHRPDAPFLAQGGTVRSYAAAAAAAAAVAGTLRARGIGPGAIVALPLPRSVDFFVAVLGVAMAGAAFLPIDLSNPPARIGAMLDRSRPACILTTASLVARFAGSGTPVIDIATLAGCAPIPPPPFAAADLAYVIFTSGTTGQPKGVAVPQRGLASLAAFQAQHLGLGPQSRVLQFAAVGFDAVVMELLMAISVGACLVLPDEAERHGAGLGAFMTRTAITHALLPPAALLGLDAATQAHPATLVVGGEACPLPLVRAWAAGRRLFNAYGPTEATACATMSEALAGDAAPIGRPIWNTRAYVLDGFGRLLAPGLEGELHIAGAGVADCYLGEAAASSLRFVPCPFPGGGRMVRSGDRARVTVDGTLECLGRMDRQMKIRGVRVEPAEIEAALCRQPGVLQAFVTVAADTPARPRLLAYVVPAPGSGTAADPLRATLAAELPASMVPAQIILLDHLPLTRHGKIDVRALPLPQAVPSPPPATLGERRLAALFAEALGCGHVGLDDDFFSLGGDSLAATVLVQRINEAMGCAMTVADVFEQPCLASLARRIADRGAPSAAPFASMLGFRVDSSQPALFCVHTGSGLGWAYSAILRHLDPAQPLYALQARGLDGRDALAGSLLEMAEDYATQITGVQPAGPYHLLGWSSGGPIAHLVASRIQARGGTVGLLASLDGYPPGPVYAGSVPPPAAFGLARNDLRAAIELYLSADASHGMARQDILDDDVLARMIHIHVNTGKLLSTGSIGTFDGDLVLFTCSEPYSPVPMPPPAAWAPFVTGRVEAIEVPGSHDMMLMPTPAAVVGRAVETRLRAWRAWPRPVSERPA